MSFKLPVSVLVVIYAKDTKRVLMLQRRDDPAFWQSVTGSLEGRDRAASEVMEEVAIDVASEQLALVDCQRTVEFEIFLIYVIAMRRALSVIRNFGSVLRSSRTLIVFTGTSGLSLG